MDSVTPLWYVEIMSSLGKWQAHLFYGQKPNARLSEGEIKTFRYEPVLVPLFMIVPRPLSLQQIGQFLSPDGEFYGYDIETCTAIADFIRCPESEIMTITEDHR